MYEGGANSVIFRREVPIASTRTELNFSLFFAISIYFAVSPHIVTLCTMLWSPTFTKNVIVATVTFLVLFKATLQVSAVPIDSIAHARRHAKAFELLPYHQNASSSSSDEQADRTYTPPGECQDACATLVNALAKCEDDSCICSQSGVDAFFQ